ncbi:hypothetical protein [Actinocorallia lasiicapitis]
MPGTAGAAEREWRSEWRVVKQTRISGSEFLVDVAAAGRRAAWAVGWREGADKTVAYHWDGRKWRRTKLPKGVGEFVQLAAAPRAGGWLLGSCAQVENGHCHKGTKSTILRWTGRAWKPVLKSGLLLNELAVAGGRDVWAFGAGRDRKKALHFDGRRWRTVTVPGQVVEAAAVSRDDIWAVAGTDHADQEPAPDTVLHYNGKKWRTYRDVLPKDNSTRTGRLRGVAVVKGKPLFTGAFHYGYKEKGFLLRRTSRGWAREQPSAFDGWIPNAPVPDGKGGLWARLFAYDDENSSDALAHRNKQGKWTVFPVFDDATGTSPHSVYAVAPAYPGTWAVGLRVIPLPDDQTEYDGFIAHTRP